MVPFLMGIAAYGLSRLLKNRYETKVVVLKRSSLGSTGSNSSSANLNTSVTNEKMFGMKTAFTFIVILIGCKLWLIQNFSTNMQISMHICVAYFLVQTVIPVLFFVKKYDKLKQALEIVKEMFD